MLSTHTDRPPTSTSTGDVLDYRAAASLLGVSYSTLRRWVYERRIPHVRLSPRCVRFSRTVLLGWLADHAVPPATSTQAP